MSEKSELLVIKDLDVRLFTERGTLPVLDHINLSLKPGEILGIVGESGCGKSMLASAIMGLIDAPLKITGGEIVFEGVNLVNASKKTLQNLRGSAISMIFQEPMTSLNPIMTCGQQIVEAILAHEKVSRKEAVARAMDMIKSVGIPMPEKVFRSVPSQLSGGMRQRIMIAMALSLRPKLLICDEPTTALDVTVQAQILYLIRKLKKELNTAVVFISHDMGVISQMSDRVAVMYAGQVVELSDKKDIFTTPAHPYAIGLQAAIPKMDGEAESLEAIPGSVPMLYDLPAGCLFSTRCERCSMKCKTEKPELVDINEDNPGHLVRCFIPAI
ncbi:ABC transporter ATP-binding protein [Oribacterium sp. WCC10]|uniref:ABC transporter ATP-binding protein n=1 Tax=Oribacterium sp. WCC10 TaxID=1855343 RepID=UPI0008EA110C|nr:ABC transporter ATP-binding protein [Oribacterium sp. WCC10]SFG76609.1 peptide/nickel transport system ATP-binding protein/oligopeptide transport system ATP-binding protein [Oribacterium sp. WCC10]